jgi:hypothetical protein
MLRLCEAAHFPPVQVAGPAASSRVLLVCRSRLSRLDCLHLPANYWNLFSCYKPNAPMVGQMLQKYDFEI